MPDAKVRDLYSLRQVSVLRACPVPANNRENILVSVWIENGFKTKIFEVEGSARFLIHCIFTCNCGTDWNEYCVLKEGL